MRLGQSILGQSLLGGSIDRGGASSPITITSPADSETIANEVYVTGTTDGTADIEYRIDAGSWATLATPSGGNYSGLITGLVAGSRTIEVRQSDATGNTASVSVTVADDEIVITSPVQHQLIRRGASATADISITFTYTGVHTTGFQARLNRTGAEGWTDFAEAASPVTISLTGEAKGYGALEVRSKSRTSISDSVDPVAIGRAVAFLGQSNSSGRGTNPQTAPANGAYLFDNLGGFRALVDPFDGNFSGSPTYSVLDDGASANGSIAPRLATNFVNDGEPILCIPANKGSTGSAAWAPSDLTTTLYGAAKARINAAGGCDWVVWQQGEADVDAGTAQATYESRLGAIVDALGTDFGCDVAIVKLYYDAGGSRTSERDAIRAAMDAVAAAKTNAFIAADLSPDNAVHQTSDTALTNLADDIYASFVGTSGTLSVTLGAASLNATGRVAIAGALSQSLSAATLSSASTLALSGVLSSTLADATLNAAGESSAPGTGSLAVTLSDAGLSAAGVLYLSGALSSALDPAGLASAGSLAIDGELAATLDDASLSAQGEQLLPISGVLTATLEDATLEAYENEPVSSGILEIEWDTGLWWQRKPKAMPEPVAKAKLKKAAKAIAKKAEEQVKAAVIADEPARKAEAREAVRPMLREMPGFDWQALYDEAYSRALNAAVAQAMREQEAMAQAKAAIDRARLLDDEDVEILMALL